VTGVAGATGAGSGGSQGATGVGAQGVTGLQGATGVGGGGGGGATGVQGATGVAGSQGATGVGGGGSSASLQYVNYTFTGFTASLQVYGTSAAASSISAVLSGGNTLTLSNIGGCVLTNITVQQEASANTTATFSIVYPEPSGQTSLTTSAFPYWMRYQSTGSITTATSTALSNSSGTLTAEITGLSASTAYYFKLIF
jgi:hypothetical protein